MKGPGAKGPEGQEGGVVLVVDDDDGFRDGLVRMLTADGYVCAAATNAIEARRRLDQAADITVALCDIRMPGASGIDLIRDIADDFPDVAVVMITGVDDPSTAALAFEIGAFGYVVKPFDRNEIRINLDNALRRRTLEIDRRRHVQDLERTITQLKGLGAVLETIDADSGPVRSGAEWSTELFDRLSRAISIRSEETSQHLERMSRYVVALAAEVGYAGASPDALRMAAALHDVGKIGIADGILMKPGALSPDERVEVQRHAVLGYQILAGTGSGVLDLASTVAVGHHEWWDGGGYPRGARGEAIPEASRITALPDVFDALTSNRVYRARLPIDEALALMAPLRGRQFEPRLFDAFCSIIDGIEVIMAEHPERDVEDARVRVLLVDDHEVFLESLVRLLASRDAVKVVGVARTVAEVCPAVRAYDPDVVLMDFELPDGDGVMATEQVKSLRPEVKVVMLTAREDTHAMVRAMTAGCSGFVTKRETADRVVEAIRGAYEGETVVPTSQLPELLNQMTATRQGVGASLRPREIEVLALVAASLTTAEIAEQLYLSTNTVRNHVQHILSKLGVHSKLEAVTIGVREGVIQLPRSMLSRAAERGHTDPA